MLLPRGLVYVIVWVTSAVFLLNFLAQFVPAFNYHPDPSINVVFPSVIGGVLLLGRNSGKSKDDDEDDDEGGELAVLRRVITRHPRSSPPRRQQRPEQRSDDGYDDRYTDG